MAPSHESLRLKKGQLNSSKSEKILEKIKEGTSIPILNRKSFVKSKEPIVKRRNSSKVSENGSGTSRGAEVNPLPEPKFTFANDSYTLPDMPSKPLHYIRYIEPSREEMDSRIDYNMDEEDMAWLESENEKRLQNSAPPVSMDDFEIIMDRFEKESYFELDREMSEEDIKDDEAICCICMDGESQPFNEILFCEMCNLAVHQECYGIPYIPEGQWLCRRCFNSPSAAVDCVLCPSNTGALKMAEGGFWTHILCAIWVPEVQFANPVFLEPVESLGKIPPSRWKLTCQLCKLKGVGACIQCTQKKCNAAFHPTCAQQAGYYMKFIGRPGEPKTKTKHSVFCSTHRPEMNGSDTDKFEHFRQKMLKNADKSPITFHPVLPPECIQGIGDRVQFKNKNVFIKKMLAYWLLKRKFRFGVPLLRTNVYELKKNISESRASPSGVSDKIVTQEEFKSCRRFRQDMEKVRLLLELVRKREKLKYELTKVKEKCLEIQLMPTAAFLRKLLQILSELDENGILEKIEVPDDSSLVIDLNTMSKKINSYEYIDFDKFEKDFNIMINNCLQNNKKNSDVHQAVVSLRNKSKSIIKKAKEDFKQAIPSYDLMFSDSQEEDEEEEEDEEILTESSNPEKSDDEETPKAIRSDRTKGRLQNSCPNEKGGRGRRRTLDDGAIAMKRKRRQTDLSG